MLLFLANSTPFDVKQCSSVLLAPSVITELAQTFRDSLAGSKLSGIVTVTDFAPVRLYPHIMLPSASLIPYYHSSYRSQLNIILHFFLARI